MGLLELAIPGEVVHDGDSSLGAGLAGLGGPGPDLGSLGAGFSVFPSLGDL